MQLAVNALHQTFFGDGVAMPGVLQKSSDVAHVLSIMRQGWEKGVMGRRDDHVHRVFISGTVNI
jgi:hypothetical protein